MVGPTVDTSKPWFAAGRVLSRYQTFPGREGSARFEVSAIVNCSHQGGSDDRSYAWQRGQALSTFVCAADLDKHVIESRHSDIKVAILLDELSKQGLG